MIAGRRHPSGDLRQWIQNALVVEDSSEPFAMEVMQKTEISASPTLPYDRTGGRPNG